ncbi:MAG: N4-gp56 family major capsid protein [Euzebyales bacterium]|nr:N4-gp56 family major capsid protein [Euzebyales bacterium]
MPLETTAVLGYDQDAWDMMTYFSFRPENYYDQLVEIRPTKQSMPGHTVKFTKTGDLALATTPLVEDVDVTPVTFTDSKVSVTMLEYGNVVKTTAYLRASSYIPLNPVVANVLGYNAGVSIDTIVRDVFHGGTNVRYAGTATSRATVANTHLLDAHDVRVANADLRNANVPTFGGKYAAFIHPHVSVDLREESGAAGWREPHNYTTPEHIWTGEVGSFEGVRFVETPRALRRADSGVGTTPNKADVYDTIFLGRQAVAKIYPIVSGFGPNPRTVPGPITDNLRRFVPMGWYHLAGWGRFREESIRRVESGSSLDPLTSD